MDPKADQVTSSSTAQPNSGIYCINIPFDTRQLNMEAGSFVNDKWILKLRFFFLSCL